VTFAWAIALGFALGLRHATDADHVVAIGTLLPREPSPAHAARLAAFWGLGHTLTFVALGLAIVVGGVHLPARFERVAELSVAAMLLGLGAWTLHRVRRPMVGVPRWRPVLVGIVHGLGGSAGVALIALTTVPSRGGALAYLAVFCLGTVAGMIALTVALSLPLGWTVRRYGAVPRAAIVGAALLSIGFGVALAVHAA
jgi:nickel/cobalt transporter (NicO) family protein